MKTNLRFFILIPLLFASLYLFAQDMNPVKTGKLVTNKSEDGVYFSSESVQKNSPDLRRSDLFISFYDTTFTIYRWAHTVNLYYHDTEKKRVKLHRDSIWGFCESGTCYIMQNGYFHKITLFGSICIFREFYPVNKDPMAVVATEKKGKSADKIYDVESGTVFDYSPDAATRIFNKDESLLNDFNALGSRKKKMKKLYLFIEKYNERHPLFL